MTAARPRRAAGRPAALLPALLAGLAGCAEGDAGAVDAPLEPQAPTCRAADPAAVEARIDAILASLTLEEKVSFMAGLPELDVTWPTPPAPAWGLPGLRLVDGPRGVGLRARVEATAFPTAILRGATFRPALEREVGAAIAREVRAAGSSVLLAPTMNVLRHPRWGRAQETYGEDPHHVGALAAAFVEGVQGEGVLATAKHFAANSIEDTRFDVDVTIDPRTLHEVYLPHFRRVVRESAVATVMTAYNAVNGAPMSSNAPLVRDVLKEGWGFEGVVMSDWVFGVESTVDAALAGLDLEMPVPEHFDEDLVAAVEAGLVPAARVDDAVRRVFRAQLCFGLDVDPPRRDAAAFPYRSHAPLAREAARRGVVLLRDAGVLPLDLGATPPPRVVVLGPLADVPNLGDTGSSDVDAPYAVTVVEGLRAAAAAAGAPEAVVHRAGALDEAALAAAADADVALVVVGLGPEDEGESLLGAGDREGLALPRDQDAFVAAVAARAARTVVLVHGSGPVELPWLEAVDAILWVGYPGQEGGHAIADVLVGAAPPSGRLPFVWPASEADLPAFDNVSLRVTYDGLHGHRHLERRGLTPTFPFAFGLSTTRLALGAVRVTPDVIGAGGEVVVEVDVTNEGPRPGAETVVVFAGRDDAPADRPLRVLVGFDQVDVPAGATRTARVSVPARALAFFDPSAGRLRLARGAHRLEVGPHAGALALAAVVTVR